MKKIFACILSLAMLTGLLSGCGSEASVPDNPLTTGYWVTDSMVMDGAEFSYEELTRIFGPTDTLMTLTFKDDMTYSGIFFEEPISGTYTETEEGYEINLNGEIVPASITDGILTLVTAEAFSLSLKNQEEMPEALAKNPWATYDPDFTAEETCAMSNFMSFGRYWIEDDILYGLTHAASNNGGLGATSFQMVGDYPEFGKATLLDDSGLPGYLTREGDYLYYTINDESICRVKLDGSSQETLYQGTCFHLQLHGERMYFTDKDFFLVSTDLEGKDLRTEISKEIYYPYFICSDWMIFQDDADNESLHLYNITYGTEVSITHEPSYSPILDGNWLYYTAFADGQYFLNRIDMSDPNVFRCEQSENPLLEAVFMIDEAYIYSTNNNGVEKEQWQMLTDDKDSAEEIEMYVSADYTVHHEITEDGILYKYLMSKETSGGVSFQ